MELVDMQAKWEEQSRKLDLSIRLNREVLKTTQMNGSQAFLRRYAIGIGLEALVNFVGVIALGNFSFEHSSEMKYFFPALALDVYMIAMNAALIRQAFIAFNLDVSQPVIKLQQQVESLRLFRVRSTQWILLAGPALWTPLLIVSMKGIWGSNAYQLLGIPYLAASMIFGALFIPLILWLANCFRSTIIKSHFLNKVLQDISGGNLREAHANLARLAAFETEVKE